MHRLLALQLMYQGFGAQNLRNLTGTGSTVAGIPSRDARQAGNGCPAEFESIAAAILGDAQWAGRIRTGDHAWKVPKRILIIDLRATHAACQAMSAGSQTWRPPYRPGTGNQAAGSICESRRADGEYELRA